MDILTTHASGMLRAAGNMAALKVDPKLNPRTREALISEAALVACLQRVIKQANADRPLQAVAHCIVQQGREHGMEYGDIMEATIMAVRDAIFASAEREVAEAGKADADKG